MSPAVASTGPIGAGLPAPIDISHHLSELTRQREVSEVKKFYKYFQIPGIGQLAGGLPFHGFFPFDTLEASTARFDRWQPTPNHPVEPPPPATTKLPNKPLNPKSAQIVVPKETEEQNILRKIDVKTALQYGQATGLASLGFWIQQFVNRNLIPDPPYAGGVQINLTCGNTDGMSKALEALSNVWIKGRNPVEEREGIVCEEFSYMGAISTAASRGLNLVTIGSDNQGMIAKGKNGLEEALKNWDTSRGKRPHLMYTVTIGQNPTGAVMGVERRQEIYNLCVEYDIVIIEDQPYWYLQYPSASKTPAYEPNVDRKSSGYPFLDSLIPSYISIDHQGRVVRLDTFSKTVAPGCRLGWITAQPALIERIQRITETSSAAPSGFVQSMIAELVMGPDAKTHRSGSDPDAGWDVEGWVRWLEGLRGNYERRMTAMCDILDQGTHALKSGRRPSLSRLNLTDRADDGHDGDGDEAGVDEADDWGVIESTPMYRYTRPRGGMFVWIEMLYGTHPLAKHSSSTSPSTSPSSSSSTSFHLPDLALALWVFLTRKPYLVLAAPGTIFGATPQVKRDSAWRYFRLSFVADEDELIAKSTGGFVRGIAAFWRIRDPVVVRELLDEVEAEDLLAGAEKMWTRFC